MQFFLSVIGFIFLVFTLGFLYVVWKVRKRIHEMRDAMQDSMNDENFRRMADKHYYRIHHDDTPPFADDYFKGDPDGSRRKQQQEQERQQQTRRTTRAAGGVTIIDDRDPNARKKIFAQDEGEYVDFTEN